MYKHYQGRNFHIRATTGCQLFASGAYSGGRIYKLTGYGVAIIWLQDFPCKTLRCRPFVIKVIKVQLQRFCIVFSVILHCPFSVNAMSSRCFLHFFAVSFPVVLHCNSSEISKFLVLLQYLSSVIVLFFKCNNTALTLLLHTVLLFQCHCFVFFSYFALSFQRYFINFSVFLH